MHHTWFQAQGVAGSMERPGSSPFFPAWMIPPMVSQSAVRKSIKNTNSDNAIGVKSIRPTWFEDIVTSREPQSQTGQEQPEPMHGLKLVIKEEALPLKEQPEFPALQRRPAHAKPDFNWLSGPRNGTWKRTCGISCLRSLAPMRRLQCSTTQATFTNPSLLRATPLLRGMF